MKEVKPESNYIDVIGTLIGSTISIIIGLFFILYDFSMYDKIKSLVNQPEAAKQLLIAVPKFFGLGLITISITMIIYSYKLNKIIKDKEKSQR